MPKSCLIGLLLLFWGTLLEAAPPALLPPLASSAAPPCSTRPGIRSVRSELVQLGNITASIASQSSREDKSACLQTSALWVTQKDVSQQFQLTGAEVNSFDILDIAPDESSILLASRLNATPGDTGSLRVAVLPLSDSSPAPKWIPVSELLGLQNCDTVFEPQGFAGAHHVVIAAIPGASSRSGAACAGASAFYSINLETHRVSVTPESGVNRQAKSISGPVQSCRTDPDVSGACYSTRARLSFPKETTAPGKPAGMVVWPLGSLHLLGVDPAMVPSDLRAEVTSDTRVYATMVICPLKTSIGPRRAICVESASALKSEAVPSTMPVRGRTTVTVIRNEADGNLQ